MRKSLFPLFLLMNISTLLLVACSTNTQNENTTIGAATGAVLGGIAGSTIGQGTGQLIAIGAGAVAGGLLGGAIGQNMDNVDKQKMYNAMDHNAKRKSSKWTNKQTHTQYTMTPMSDTIAHQNHSVCRKYRATITKDTDRQVEEGIACRDNQGEWKIVQS